MDAERVEFQELVDRIEREEPEQPPSKMSPINRIAPEELIRQPADELRYNFGWFYQERAV